MRIWAMCLTARGCELARVLANALAAEGDEVRVCGCGRHVQAPGVQVCDDLHAWTREAFARSDALLFVSACGIAVRAIAPFVRDKLSDPAVVCVDEAGSFAVSLLSGHVGGANKLARRVARACGGQAVVTTATDVNEAFAVDVWAARQGLVMLDRDVAKEVSAALLAGESVGFVSDIPVVGTLPRGLVQTEGRTGSRNAPALGVSVSLDEHKRPFARTLRLVPRTMVVGVGCRRGTDVRDVAALVDASLAEVHVASQAVCALATIDLKANEPGIVALAQERGWDLRLFSAEKLVQVPGSFSASSFVRQTVGVDNVCERAACTGGGSLLLRKHAAHGVTVALAVEERCVSFDDPYGGSDAP